MKLFTYFALCALVLFVSACKKDDNSPIAPNSSTPASDYWMPGAAGTRLTLEGSDVVYANGVKVDSTTSMYQLTMQSGTMAMLDGTTARIMQAISVNAGVIDTSLSYWVLSATSILMYEDTGLTIDKASTQLKSPLTPGNSWKVKTDDTTMSTIVSVTEAVSTPAGTFQNCIVVRSVVKDFNNTGVPATQDYFLAKGVGLVRMLITLSGTVQGVPVSMTSDTRLKSKSF